jgi:hypothetical protein
VAGKQQRPSQTRKEEQVKPDHEFGLMIEPVNRHGTEYVEVHVVRREPGRDAPLGCSGDGEDFLGYGTPKHLLGLVLDGLGMYGFVSESSDVAFIGHEVEFRNVYATDERKLSRMLKAIKRVNAQLAKDDAREPGDKLVALAKALKLTFVVERVGPPRHDPDWRYMTIAEGRNRYRTRIEDAVLAATTRRAG